MPLLKPNRCLIWVKVPVIMGLVIAGVCGVFLWMTDWSDRFLRDCEDASSKRQWETLARTAERWSLWNPQESDAWWYRAQAATAKSDWEPAADFLGRIPSTSHRASRSCSRRTEILFHRVHRMSEALATCQRLLETKSNDCEAQRWVIFIHAITMRQTELLRQISRADQVNCDYVDAIVYLMRADLLVFENTYELMSQFLKVTPDDEACLVARAIHIVQGPIPPNAEATPGDESELEECLRRFPHNPEVLAYFLDAASQEGDLERVSQLLEQFNRDDRQDSRFWYYTAWRYSQLEELAQAEEAIHRALDFYRCDIRAQQLLSGILRRTGQKEDAERWARTASLGYELKRILEKIPRTSMVAPQLLKQIAVYAESSGDQLLLRMIHRQLPKAEAARKSSGESRE